MTKSSENVAPEMSVAQQRKAFKAALIARFPNLKCGLRAHGRAGYMLAVCTKASGFNRVCSLEIEQVYSSASGTRIDVAYFGYGKRSKCLGRASGSSLEEAVAALKASMSDDGKQSAKFYGSLEPVAIPKEKWGQ